MPILEVEEHKVRDNSSLSKSDKKDGGRIGSQYFADAVKEFEEPLIVKRLKVFATPAPSKIKFES